MSKQHPIIANFSRLDVQEGHIGITIYRLFHLTAMSMLILLRQ